MKWISGKEREEDRNVALTHLLNYVTPVFIPGSWGTDQTRAARGLYSAIENHSELFDRVKRRTLESKHRQNRRQTWSQRYVTQILYNRLSSRLHCYPMTCCNYEELNIYLLLVVGKCNNHNKCSVITLKWNHIGLWLYFT